DAHRLLGVADRAVFSAQDQVADGLLERGARPGEGVGQTEHDLVLAIGHGKPEFAVEDRQGLLNEVQPGLRELCARILAVHLSSVALSLAPPAGRAEGASAACYNS